MKKPSWFPIRPEYDSISGVAASSRSMPPISFWVSMGEVPGGAKKSRIRAPSSISGRKPVPSVAPSHAASPAAASTTRGASHARRTSTFAPPPKNGPIPSRSRATRLSARVGSATGTNCGTSVRQRIRLALSMSAMVSASTRKNAPATPPSQANGRKIASVQPLEASIPGRISASPTASGTPVRCARYSTTTIASSATSPMDAAMPPRVIMSSPCPASRSTMSVIAIAPGSTSARVSPSRRLPRNSMTIRISASVPMSSASRAPAIESRTSRDWS